MEFIFQILLVVLLVLLNGYFVASEFALVGVRKTRIDELVKRGNATAQLVQQALVHLDTYISATQLGITLSSLALGWIGEPAIAHFLEPYFSFLNQEQAFLTAHSLAVAIAFSIITVLHIVLGELAPKTIALQRAERTSLYIILPLMIFTAVFRPFIWFLNGAGNLVLRLVGFNAPSGHQLVHSEEEIKMILNQSGESGLISKKEIEMVQNIFKLGDTTAKQIMVPRTDIVAFNAASLFSEILKKIKRHTHSRFPVYENSVDNIIGFIHVKEIYQLALKEEKDQIVSRLNVITPIITIPETEKVDQVLVKMRSKRVHMAIVHDEFGGTSGLVTLEDVIESVIGEIEDEFEKSFSNIKKQSDGSYLISGLTTIEKIQEKFVIPIKGQGYSTIGGLVLGLIGHDPRIGDELQIGNIRLKIESIEGKRIKLVSIRKLPRGTIS